MDAGPFRERADEMGEAAQIDGASTWQQFWQVQVPLAIPAILSLAILLFL